MLRRDNQSRVRSPLERHCQRLLVHARRGHSASKRKHRKRSLSKVAPAPPTPPAHGGTPRSPSALAASVRAAAPTKSCPNTARTAGCVSKALAAALPALEPAGTAQINGKVTDAKSKAPIEGVEVCADSEEDYECALTDASGNYDITGLSAGKYRVWFAPQYESALNYVYQYYDGKSSYAEATPVVLAAAGTASGIDAALQEGGQINGTVTDAKSKAAIEGIEVCAFTIGEGQYVERCAPTDHSGHYDIVGLASNEYRVEFFPGNESGLNYLRQYYNGKANYYEADPVSVTAGATTPGIDAAMGPAGQITGTVINGVTRAAAAEVRVCAYSVSEGYGNCAQTNASGEYDIVGLTSGQFRVEFAPSEYESHVNYLHQYYNGKTNYYEAELVSVTAGATTSGIDAALQPGGEIGGTVTSAVTSKPLAEVTACTSGGYPEYINRCATTDASGEYTIVGLPTGSYTVTLSSTGPYATQYYDGKVNYYEATPVSVTVGELTPGIDATMQLGAEVSGRVTNAATKAPLADIEVCPILVSGGYSISCTWTGPGGEYTLSKLPASEYRVEFYPPSEENYLVQYYDGASSSSDATILTLAAGESTSGINAALHEGGVVTGTVTDAATKARLTRIEVCADETSGEFFDRCTFTNSKGEYSVVGLPSGSYTVAFAPYESEYATQYYNGQSTSDAATPVEVTAGATKPNINAALHPASSITGIVTSKVTKAPAYNAEVCAIQASDGAYVKCVYTSTSGQYDITGLSPGEYKVGFGLSNANFTPQYYNAKPTLEEADVLTVSSGETIKQINAELKEGGEITGTVTDATTTKPVEGIEVCTEGYVSRCAYTNASGEYTIAGLTTGEYRVHFYPYAYPYGLLNYLPQYYNGTDNYYEADEVSVTTDEVTSGIDAALQPGGKISGTVTNAETKAPITNASVCASPRTSGNGNCASTNASGEYTIVGLSSGEFTVEFAGGGQNYVRQYYNGKVGYSESTPVPVTVENATPNINAAMEVGGEVTGTVTAAKTKLPLANIEVEMLQASTGSYIAGTYTNSKGEYTALGLPTGEDKVEFYAYTGEYKTQYYREKNSLGEATPISVTSKGHVKLNINAALLVVPPVVNTPPTITGTDQEGKTLTEHHGAWGGSPTEYTYQWVRCNSGGFECKEIEGATAQTYAPVFADVGERLRVEETAHNEGGASSPSSSALTEVIAVAPPENSTPPKISGTAQQGKTLTVLAGVWTNAPTRAKWQWLRCNSEGGECGPIGGATASTYEAVEADVNHTLRVEEIAENAAGPGAPATSTQTAVVVPPIPVNITPPKVTGTAQQGKELAAQAGTWQYSPTELKYQWLQCNALGEGCFPIGGATEAKYVARREDVGHTLRVEEFAKNAGGTSPAAISAATAKVLPAPPVNVSPPTISGTAQQGQTLTEHHGSWENNPTGYAYEWLRCDAEGEACLPIGAKEEPYVPTAADVGHTIRVSETAKNAGGTGEPAESSPTAVVVPPAPVDETPPTITGTPKQGKTLTENNGSWSNSPTGYTHQWLRCDGKGASCEEIGGATGETYVLTGEDIEHTIRVGEIAENEGGAGEPATSDATAAVVSAIPENVSLPTITGTAQQGQTLTEHHGNWTNEPEEGAYKLRWLRCNDEGAGCEEIGGATGESYEPTEADVGHAVRVQEIAHNPGGDSSPATSEPTAAVVTPAPVNLTVPTITGTATQGQILTEHPGTWDYSPTSSKLQWLQCDSLGEACLPISGATGPTYEPKVVDVGHTIRVEEVAINAGGNSPPATSEPTSPITSAAPSNISPPSINGVANVGSELTETHGTWTNDPTSFDYQWLRCEPTGDGCEEIANAEAPTYSPTAEDVGHTLRVRETASNSGGESEAVSSAATQPVAPRAKIEALITGGPSGDTNRTGPFTFEASGGGTLECAVDDQIYVPCMSPLTLEGLEDGPHTLYVRAVDAFGVAEAPPVHQSFELDTQPPTVTITSSPSEPIHNGSLEIAYESSEAGEVECAFDKGEWHGCGGENFVAEEFANGEHLLEVRAVDKAGNVSNIATASFTVVNQPPTASLQVSKDAGPAPVETTATIQASDPDNDGLHYELQFGDGSSASGVLPAGPIDHSYQEPGVYEMRLDVSDGHEHAIVTHTVVVTLDEPIQAKAGEDQTVIAGEPVSLDGEDSRPLRGITGYHWDLGDGEEADGATVEHPYASPGDYHAKLTVTAPGEVSTSTLTIHVLPKPGGEGYVETVVSGGAPLQGAEVLVIEGDGTRIRGTSGTDGKAHLYGLGDGEYEAYVYKPGYVPAATHATVSAGEGSGTLELKAGNTAEAHVTSHPMTLTEIEDAGIDPNDPANRHVYEFDVDINVVPFAGGGGGGGGGGGSFGGYIGGAGFVGGPCNDQTLCVWHAGGATIYTTITYVPGFDAPILSSLVIPFKASWLKEFFDVSLIVDNLAGPPFTLKGGHATISVPAGMSLAPTAAKQAQTLSLPDIPGEGSATAHWILRGDTEGFYNIAATYAASLEPFGRTINIDGETTTPIHVWGASAVQLTVDVDQQLKDSYPFHVKVGMKDVADVPVYDPEIELLKAGRHGYIEQPAQQNTYQTREIAPGETFWSGEFILVPEATGEVDLAHSFIQKIGGDVELHPSLVTHDRQPSLAETPEIKGHRRNSSTMVIEWDRVPGATQYKVFKTPDRETDFPDTADPTTEQLSDTKAVVRDAPSDPQVYFAVSSLLDGKWTMVHPMIGSGQVTPGEYPHLQVTDESACGGPAVAAKATFTDPDFPLKHWSGAINGTALDGGVLAGNSETVPLAGQAAPGDLTPYSLTVESEEGTGTSSPTTTAGTLGECRTTGIGDSFSAGEGNKPFEPGTRGETPSENNCHRSEKAAFAKIAAEDLDGVTLTRFKACSGATTSDYWSPQEANTNAQADEIAADANLVTLSMGGNDLYFSKFLEGCIADHVANLISLVKGWNIPPCKVAAAPIIAALMPDIRSRLEGVYRDILGKPGRPRVIVMGYPEIFPEVAPISLGTCDLISGTDIQYWHETTEDVNAEIEAAAHAAGAEFVNPNDFNGHRRFEGHDVCRGEPDSFFNPLIKPGGGHALGESFHPNGQGQKEMAKALDEAITHPEGTAQNLHTGENLLQKAIVTDTESALTAAIRWPGSDVELRLKAPDGETIDRENIPSGVEHHLTGTAETYTVSNAEPGDWEVEAIGKDLAPSGEMVSLNATVTPHHEKNPQAVFESTPESGSAPLHVEFDGDGSVDPEGHAFSYEWSFGDGTSGTAVATSHVYEHGGEYWPTLSVKTDDGRANMTVGAPIVVNEIPTVTYPPTVEGTPEAGQTLTCNKGQWTGYPAPTYEIAWERDGEPIGASGSEYVVATEDLSHEIRCTVDASNEIGRNQSHSEGIEIGGKPTNTNPPEVTGLPEHGKRLSCAPGEWTGEPTYTYQWLRDGVKLTTATTSTLHVGSADTGHTLSCVVVAANSSGAAEATSAGALVPRPGCGDYWLNQSGGDWATGTNWSTGKPPASGEGACILINGTYEVQLDGSIQSIDLQTLRIGGGEGSQALILESSCAGSADITATEGTQIGSRGAVTLSDADACANGDSMAGPVTNEGTLTVLAGQGGTRAIDGDVTNTHLLALAAGAQLHITGAYHQTSQASVDSAMSGSSGFGSLAASGAATLDGGTLHLTHAPPTPSLGEVFPILTSAAVTGTIAKVTGARISSDGLYYEPFVTGGSFELHVAQASLSVSPSSAPPGSTVRLSGSGYLPGDTITPSFTARATETQPAQKTAYPPVTTNSEGEFETEIVIPPSVPAAKDKIAVKSGETNVSIKQAFTVG